jgi:hypothetical protein
MVRYPSSLGSSYWAFYFLIPLATTSFSYKISPTTGYQEEDGTEL